jgi:hypothetical protein
MSERFRALPGAAGSTKSYDGPARVSDVDHPGDAGAASPLLSGADLTLWGVTTDGTIVYRDGSTMMALPPGGQPTPIAPVSGITSGGVYGDVLLVVSQTSTSSVATVTVWTAQHGVRTLSTSALPIELIPSPDDR